MFNKEVRESAQKKLERVRVPHVRLTYDVETGSAIELRELPFEVGILADLSGNAEPQRTHLRERTFLDIDFDNFDEVLKRIGPCLTYTVDNKLGESNLELAVELHFERMDDFDPANIATQVELLHTLLEARQQLSSLRVYTDDNDGAEELLIKLLASPALLHALAAGQKLSDEGLTLEGCGLSALLEEKFRPRTAQAQQALERAVHTLAEQASRQADLIGKDAIESIEAIIAKLDRLLSDQINLLMHHEEFQRLESAWRGLHLLVSRTETSSAIKLRVLNVSKRELMRDLERATSFDQSALFKHVYEEEYGTFGGRAFGLLLGDYAFGREPGDLALLERIACIAAAAHAPFIAAAKPTLFGLESFADFSQPRDLSQVFVTVEYAKWRSFRDSNDAKYVGLTLPRILLRHPYGDSHPVEAFAFREQVESHDDWLWGNPAYALGSCITNAFAKYHWCAAIKGIEGGGLVEGLPCGTFLSDEGEPVPKCPTELRISDRREKELADLGFIPLLHVKGTDYAAFFSMQTCCKPRLYDNEAANANAYLSTQLQYVLTTSRFAHYLKCIIRDRLGSLTTRAECENLLNNWIRQYVSGDSVAAAEHKARFPLREAHVDVTEIPGKPGLYRAVAFLRPHFQLDELSISMRLVVEIPAAAKS